MNQPPNFDRLARVYHWMELVSFGPWLRRCRCARLPEMQGARRALVLGDGDGRFTARLLQFNPKVEVDAVDCSRAMLRQLERRAAADAARLRTYRKDIRRLEPTALPGNEAESYDLVVTHFFLDCLTTGEVQELARSLRPVLSPGARWVVSEFAVPGGWCGRLVARTLVEFLYIAFVLLTGLSVRRLPDHGAALQQAGFTRQDRREWLSGLLCSEIWQAPGD